MKFTLAVIVYILIGLVLSWGILGIMRGHYWFFIAGLAAYLFAFARIGCLHH